MEMKEAGKSFPYAQHINTVCNDKIKNIPEDFNGIFVVEESYYETDGKRHASPHLFRLQIVTLELYFLMKFLQEKTRIHFHNSMKSVDYSELKNLRSLRQHYIRKIMEAGREEASQFTPVMIFRLWERFSEACLEVSERWR